jgi:L-lactate dehydrogenase complex protein LldE
MIKNHYAELFEQEPRNLQRAEQLRHRIFEVSEFLYHHVDRLSPSPAPDTTIAYHPACHLQRGLKINHQPQALLHRSGIKLVELDDDCCGFGGLFSIEHADVSDEMLKRKIQAIEKSGADTVVACLWFTQKSRE